MRDCKHSVFCLKLLADNQGLCGLLRVTSPICHAQAAHSRYPLGCRVLWGKIPLMATKACGHFRQSCHGISECSFVTGHATAASWRASWLVHCSIGLHNQGAATDGFVAFPTCPRSRSAGQPFCLLWHSAWVTLELNLAAGQARSHKAR